VKRAWRQARVQGMIQGDRAGRKLGKNLTVTHLDKESWLRNWFGSLN